MKNKLLKNVIVNLPLFHYVPLAKHVIFLLLILYKYDLSSKNYQRNGKLKEVVIERKLIMIIIAQSKK